MLLIHPPVAKPCEPPAGIARLAGTLRTHGLSCSVFDANLEALLYLMHAARPKKDPWSRRACKNRRNDLEALRSPCLYTAPERYRRAVADVNHLLDLAASNTNLEISLSNYQERNLTPVKSRDLLRMAENFYASIFFPWFSKRLPEVIDDCSPAFIGFSLNYLSQALTTFAMIGWLKNQYPGIQIVLGGGLVTSWMSNPAWNDPFAGLVDFCITGQGEGPLLALAGKQESPLFFSDYTGFELGSYLAPGFILPYSASAGCSWRRCSFCPEQAEANPYLAEKPQRTVAAIRQLAEATPPVLLHLLDNAVSPPLMRALIDAGPGIPWYGFARVTADLADPDFCHSLYNSGCRMLKLGIESADRNVLAAMNKGIDPDLVSRVLSTLKNAGIATYVYLLFGTPAESLSEARTTLAFIAGHHLDIDFLNLAIFNLPITSSEATRLEIVDRHAGDLSLYADFVHPRGWDRRQVRRFLDREFRRQPLIARILRRDPPLFTSNHAPFFRRDRAGRILPPVKEGVDARTI